MSENPEEIIKYGVFKGFNIFVLIIVVLQALTGLVSSRHHCLKEIAIIGFTFHRPWH